MNYARKAAVNASPGFVLESTESLDVFAFRSGVLSVPEADAIKAVWEANHRFKLLYGSFGERVTDGCFRRVVRGRWRAGSGFRARVDKPRAPRSCTRAVGRSGEAGNRSGRPCRKDLVSEPICVLMRGR